MGKSSTKVSADPLTLAVLSAQNVLRGSSVAQPISFVMFRESCDLICVVSPTLSVSPQPTWLERRAHIPSLSRGESQGLLPFFVAGCEIGCSQ